MVTTAKMALAHGPLDLLEREHAGIQSHLRTLTECAASAFGLCLTGPARDRMIRALDFFREAIPRGVADEERSLFPRLRAVRGEAGLQFQEPIEMLEADNDDAQRFFGELDRIGAEWIATGWIAPERLARFDECVSMLAAIYRDHVALEQRVLLPLAEQFLPAADQLRIEREMLARRT